MTCLALQYEGNRHSLVLAARLLVFSSTSSSHVHSPPSLTGLYKSLASVDCVKGEIPPKSPKWPIIYARLVPHNHLKIIIK